MGAERRILCASIGWVKVRCRQVTGYYYARHSGITKLWDYFFYWYIDYKLHHFFQKLKNSYA